MSDDRVYRLPDRRTGTVLFGLSVPQLLLSASGVAALVLMPAVIGSSFGVLAGVAVAAGCGLLGFVQVGGQAAYQAVLVLATFVLRRLVVGGGWTAPLPPPAGSLAQPRSRPARGRLPRCLAGLDLVAVDRPDWAGRRRTAAPIGLIADRRSGTLTAMIGARGSEFSLLDPPEQHRRLTGWAQVLSQFAREQSPVARIGWSLRSQPALPTGVAEQAGSADQAEYQRIVSEVAAAGLMRRELRVWLTVDPRRASGDAGALSSLAVAAARTLTDRCRAAGLVCTEPLSPLQLAEAARLHADPSVVPLLSGSAGSLAERAGLGGAPDLLPDLAALLPLAVRADWDAVQVDGAWHRVFWVAGWPTGRLPADWWQPLLHDLTGTRTLAVVMEPVPTRASRRRINAESVSIEGQLQLRDKHAFRIPVRLQQAHAEVDQREAELNAGYPEYSYLALVCVTAASRAGLDAACQTALDAAARCGIVELRPLHGRHAAAWACTLPVGRIPDGLLGGSAR